MWRRIIVNLLVALIVFPISTSMRYWENIANGIYRIQDAYYSSLTEYISVLLHEMGYPMIPLLFLLFLLLPFQLIKDWSYRKGFRIPLLIKCLIFSIIFMFYYALLARGYMGYMMSSNPMKYWGPVIGFGIFYPVLLYFLVDRYVEKKKLPNKDDEVPL